MYMLRLDTAGKIVDGMRERNTVKKREEVNEREKKMRRIESLYR